MAPFYVKIGLWMANVFPKHSAKLTQYCSKYNTLILAVARWQQNKNGGTE
jgi:hypothetical protein